MEKYNPDSKESYILGISLIVEALENRPKEVKEIILSNKAYQNKELDKMLTLCELHNIACKYDDSIIAKLSLKENCYGIGVLRKYPMQLKTDKHLVLYGFSDYGELGTIIRSAVSFDLRDIVLADCDIDIFNPKVIRASMGSFFHANIVQYASLKDYLNDYKYHLYPFTGDYGKELKTIKIQRPYSIVIPSKYHALDNEFMETYYLKHRDDEVALTSLAAIVFNYFYHQNADGKNI